jgi:hypothetical protein
VSSTGLVPTAAGRTPVDPSQRPILLDVTVPRFSGMVRRIVVAALGIHDIAQMFDEARVGDIDEQPTCATFRLALDHGLEAGAKTRMGPVLVGNDDGQVRLTLPAQWAPVARMANLKPTMGTEPDGTPVCRLWAEARPGAAIEAPLPLGAPGAYRLAVRVVGPDAP